MCIRDSLNLGLQLGLLGFQLLQAVSLGGDLLLDFLGLGGLAGVLLGLAHQCADLLGQLVAVCAQVAGLADGGAVLGVELDDLIDEMCIRDRIKAAGSFCLLNSFIVHTVAPRGHRYVLAVL